MNDTRKRAHSVVISIGGDTQADVINALQQIIIGIKRGEYRGVSGGYSSGYSFEYIDNPEMTHDIYFAELDEALQSE